MPGPGKIHSSTKSLKNTSNPGTTAHAPKAGTLLPLSVLVLLLSQRLTRELHQRLRLWMGEGGREGREVPETFPVLLVCTDDDSEVPSP